MEDSRHLQRLQIAYKFERRLWVLSAWALMKHPKSQFHTLVPWLATHALLWATETNEPQTEYE